MHDFIDKIVDVKGDGNYGYRSVAGLLGMGQDSWSVVRNHLLKELANFLEEYIKLFGGTEIMMIPVMLHSVDDLLHPHGGSESL